MPEQTPPEAANKPSATLSKRMTRKNAVKAITAFGVGALTLRKLAMNDDKPASEPRRKEQKTQTEEETNPLNPILSLPPNRTEPDGTVHVNPERLEAEKTYIASVLAREVGSQNIEFNNETVAMIDRGLWVSANFETRSALLAKRYEIRQSGKSRLKVLSQEQVNWAHNQKKSADDPGIDPETLGICLDSEEKAREIIDDMKTLLRPDLTEIDPNLDPTRLMINPGGLAALIEYETDGFRNAGTSIAMQEINDAEDAFPTAKEDLRTLAQNLSEDTNLHFVPDSIPGAWRGDPTVNKSGGAIGIQFMPNNALEIYSLMNSYGYKANPFDPESSAIMAWVFLARREEVMPGKFREGYLRGDPEQISFAIQKWHQWPDEEKFILNAAYSYFDAFLEPSSESAQKDTP